MARDDLGHIRGALGRRHRHQSFAAQALLHYFQVLHGLDDCRHAVVHDLASYRRVQDLRP